MLEVASQVYAAGQLFETDLQLISKQGARSVINTRPDNESEGQPLSADLAKVAEEYGITFVHFPIESGSISQETAEAFAKACHDLERPLIVCGRSGALAARIWETAELAD
jgi:sulfide:quinone oxidoreductase